MVAYGCATALLVAATWLYHGYSFGRWPQPGFLVNVLALQGGLDGDWFTSLPAVHWAFSHGLALLPSYEWVEPTILVLWLIYLVVLWGSILSIMRTLGVSWSAGVGMGLILAATELNGLGLSAVLQEYLYPTGLAFSFGLLSLALVLRDRLVVGGMALGLAALVHPGSGALLIAVIAPAVLVGRVDRISAAVRFGVPCLILAVPSLARVAIDQAGGSSLSSEQRFALLAEVRLPHHMLYSEFPLSEYLTTAAWLSLGMVSVWALRRQRAVQIVATVGVATLCACLVGAWAGYRDGPLALVQLQTSRVTPLLIVIGAVLGAALLVRLAGAWATPVIVFIAAVALAAIDLMPALAARLPGPVTETDITLGLLQAVLLACALGTAALVRHHVGGRAASWLPAAGVVVALGVVAASIAEYRAERSFGTTLAEQQLADIARHARRLSEPGDLVLSPPDLDGISVLTRRPAVVSFGTYAFGSDDDEWITRMLDVTGEPEVLDPNVGGGAAARNKLAAESYDDYIATSREPLCAYRPELVITRTAAPLPAWLDPVYRNETYTLSRPHTACG